MDPFSQYQAMPHEQVNWAALAQQWMAMKEPQYGHDMNWEAASRGKPIFPSATNIRFDPNGRPPPPPPSSDYPRPPPPSFPPPRPGPSPGDWTASRNEDWRVPPHGWNQGPPRIPHPPARAFFPPPPPRAINGAPPPPLMGLRPPPPPMEDDWGFGWTPPPPRMKAGGPPAPLFPSASTAPPPPVPLFPPPPQNYQNNFQQPENVPSPEVPFFSADAHLDDNARNKLPAWIREGLEKAELEKKKQAEKEERIRKAEEEKRKRRELAGKSKFDSDSSDEENEEEEGNPGKNDNFQAKEPVPMVTEEDVREKAMLYIRQFMTRILTEGTDQLLRVTCSEAMKEAEKAEAEPKLLAKSSALAALSNLGDDDDEDSDADEKLETKEKAKEIKDDFVFKAPIGIPKNFSKTSPAQGTSKPPQQLTKMKSIDEPDEKSKIVENKLPSKFDKEQRGRSRSKSPRRRRRSRSRSSERKHKRKRDRSRERKRSRSRESKRRDR